MAEQGNRKLIVLGLPWESDESALQSHFSEYGQLDSVELIRDKLTGSSRGFGFVTFEDVLAAERALNQVHTIDGRRCDVKVAVPKGEALPPKTRRIFVARIPPNVTEAQFREYFEGFGEIEDAYMPKDKSRQNYRGIGFITFTDSTSTERVMAVKHRLNDQEVVVDRASPKESSTPIQPARHMPTYAAEPSLATTVGTLMSVPSTDAQIMSGLGGLQAPQSLESKLHLLQSLQAQQYAGSMGGPESVMDVEERAESGGSPASIVLPPTLSSELAQPSLRASSCDLTAMTAAMASHGLPVEVATAAMDAASMPMVNEMMLGGLLPQAQMPVTTSVGSFHQPLSDSGRSQKGESSRVSDVRGGPRIFVGKLTKDTTEQDLREYFLKYGYVMDVYMPRSKENKKEHRGFGFVTFETEAAIQRVVAHGTHNLKGAAIAIDVAVPEEPASPLEAKPAGSYGGSHAGSYAGSYAGSESDNPADYRGPSRAHPNVHGRHLYRPY